MIIQRCQNSHFANRSNVPPENWIDYNVMCLTRSDVMKVLFVLVAEGQCRGYQTPALLWWKQTIPTYKWASCWYVRSHCDTGFMDLNCIGVDRHRVLSKSRKTFRVANRRFEWLPWWLRFVAIGWLRSSDRMATVANECKVSLGAPWRVNSLKWRVRVVVMWGVYLSWRYVRSMLWCVSSIFHCTMRVDLGVLCCLQLLLTPAILSTCLCAVDVRRRETVLITSLCCGLKLLIKTHYELFVSVGSGGWLGNFSAVEIAAMLALFDSGFLVVWEHAGICSSWKSLNNVLCSIIFSLSLEWFYWNKLDSTRSDDGFAFFISVRFFSSRFVSFRFAIAALQPNVPIRYGLEKCFHSNQNSTTLPSFDEWAQ